MSWGETSLSWGETTLSLGGTTWGETTVIPQNPSCVNSFSFFFCPTDRPTITRGRAMHGKRNILLGWPYEITSNARFAKKSLLNPDFEAFCHLRINSFNIFAAGNSILYQSSFITLKFQRNRTKPEFI